MFNYLQVTIRVVVLTKNLLKLINEIDKFKKNRRNK
jgi:hypothetical protein